MSLGFQLGCLLPACGLCPHMLCCVLYVCACGVPLVLFDGLMYLCCLELFDGGHGHLGAVEEEALLTGGVREDPTHLHKRKKGGGGAEGRRAGGCGRLKGRGVCHLLQLEGRRQGCHLSHTHREDRE